MPLALVVGIREGVAQHVVRVLLAGLADELGAQFEPGADALRARDLTDQQIVALHGLQTVVRQVRVMSHVGTCGMFHVWEMHQRRDVLGVGVGEASECFPDGSAATGVHRDSGVSELGFCGV